MHRKVWNMQNPLAKPSILGQRDDKSAKASNNNSDDRNKKKNSKN